MNLERPQKLPRREPKGAENRLNQASTNHELRDCERNSDGEPVRPAPSRTCKHTRSFCGRSTDEAKVRGFPSGPWADPALPEAGCMAATGFPPHLCPPAWHWGAVHVWWVFLMHGCTPEARSTAKDSFARIRLRPDHVLRKADPAWSLRVPIGCCPATGPVLQCGKWSMAHANGGSRFDRRTSFPLRAAA